MDPVSEKFWTVLRKAQQRYASQCSRRANRSVATVSNGTRDLNRSASQEEAMEAPKEDSVERCKVTVALTLSPSTAKEPRIRRQARIPHYGSPHSPPSAVPADLRNFLFGEADCQHTGCLPIQDVGKYPSRSPRVVEPVLIHMAAPSSPRASGLPLPESFAPPRCLHRRKASKAQGFLGFWETTGSVYCK